MPLKTIIKRLRAGIYRPVRKDSTASVGLVRSKVSNKIGLAFFPPGVHDDPYYVWLDDPETVRATARKILLILSDA